MTLTFEAQKTHISVAICRKMEGFEALFGDLPS
jgi:hypothetical protein